MREREREIDCRLPHTRLIAFYNIAMTTHPLNYSFYCQVYDRGGPRTFIFCKTNLPTIEANRAIGLCLPPLSGSVIWDLDMPLFRISPSLSDSDSSSFSDLRSSQSLLLRNFFNTPLSPNPTLL